MSPPQAGPPGYAFGDSEPAARRLALVAEVLAASSAALLRDATAGRPPPRLAVDLGCGPGHTTALVAASSGAPRTVGLDRSDRFLAAARDRYPHLEFAVHDVTRPPFPARPADLIYARFLLAHLPGPAGQARAWARELRPGGRLVLEETEWLDQRTPVLARYEELVVPVVAARGGPLYAGPALAALAVPDLRVVRSAVLQVSVPLAASARVHELNLQVWRDDPYARAHYDPAALDELAVGLRDLAATGGPPTVWAMRQVIVERVADAG
jgi:SAM-dependent methyltransferase